MANSDNKQIALNLVFNTISFAINFIISFFFTPYLIRTVGKEAYSFFPLVNNIIGYSSVITAAIGSMAGRFITMRIYNNDIEGANRYLNSMWVANLVLSVFFTIVSALFVIFIDNILTIPSYLLTEVRWLFVFGTATMILGLLTGFLSLATYIKNRIDLSSSRHVATNIIRISSILLLFYLFTPSIVYMSLSALIGALIGVGLNYNLKKKLLPELTISPRKFFDFGYIKKLAMSGIWNSINQLSNLLLHQVDLLITNIFLGAAITGDFSIAKTAPTLILNMLAMLSGTFIPHFNILYAKGQIDKLVKETEKSMAIIGLLIGLPIGFLTVFSDSFYSLWVPGQDSTLLYWMTLWTLLPMVFGGSINPVFGLFTTTNRLKVPSLVLLLSGLVNTIITVVLLKTTDLGVWAIILVSAVQSTIRNVLFTPIYGAIVLNQKLTIFLPTLMRGVFSMCMVVAVGFAFKYFVTIETWMQFFLVLIVVCTISLILNSFVALKKSERIQMYSIIARKLRIK